MCVERAVPNIDSGTCLRCESVLYFSLPCSRRKARDRGYTKQRSSRLSGIPQRDCCRAAKQTVLSVGTARSIEYEICAGTGEPCPHFLLNLFGGEAYIAQE